jgi:hypothetical protein
VSEINIWPTDEWKANAAATESLGLDPCEGCGKPGVVVDVDGCDLCQECADGCEMEKDPLWKS